MKPGTLVGPDLDALRESFPTHGLSEGSRGLIQRVRPSRYGDWFEVLWLATGSTTAYAKTELMEVT